jgi:putative phosphoesterase
MKLGVLSDTHDNLPAIAAAIKIFKQAGIEALLHAGDYVAPFALARLIQARLPVYGVFGNCDGERAGLMKLLPELADGPRHLEIGGRKICLIHDWERLSHENFEASDIVVFGHTHEPKIERHEGRLIVNPGECGGWMTGRATVAILNTEAMAAETEEVRLQAAPIPASGTTPTRRERA